MAEVRAMSDSELMQYRKKLERDSLEMAFASKPRGEAAQDAFDQAHAELEHEIWEVVEPELKRRGK